MNCPSCAVELRMSERHGIEIDYCPQCRGVWLDRGELDKIIERATAEQTVSAAPIRRAEEPETRRRERDERDHEEHYGKRRKKSFLSELFD